MSRDVVPATLTAHLQNPASSSSIGGWGAIAEFHWLAGERPRERPHRVEAVTGRGTLRIAIRERAVERGETPLIGQWRRRFDRRRPPPHLQALH